MKKTQFTLYLAALCLFGKPAAHAQAVVSAPILEGTNFIQTGLQATLKALNAHANDLANDGVVEQVLTKGFTEKNMLLAKDWYDGLLAISNTIKTYRRVQHIFERQTAIITIYSNYIGKFKADPNLSPAQVAGMSLTSREPGSGTREVVEQALAAHGLVAVPPVAELTKATAVREAVLAGGAPAFVSRRVVERELEARRLVRVPTALGLERVFRAIWSGAREPAAGPARELVALAKGHA